MRVNAWVAQYFRPVQVSDGQTPQLVAIVRWRRLSASGHWAGANSVELNAAVTGATAQPSN